MTDRIAVLADIHGNLPALQAVLADVDRIGVDLIVLNGDLADGPFPVQTLELLESLGDRAVWVRCCMSVWRRASVCQCSVVWSSSR